VSFSPCLFRRYHDYSIRNFMVSAREYGLLSSDYIAIVINHDLFQGSVNVKSSDKIRSRQIIILIVKKYKKNNKRVKKKELKTNSVSLKILYI